MEETEIKFQRDKIFDNAFGSSEVDILNKSFQLDKEVAERQIDEKIDESIYCEQVKEILLGNPDYYKFNSPLADGSYLKIGKLEINDMYQSVLKQIPGLKNIEAFSIITSIYDISPEKFYESLSNKFKTDLIEELRRRGYLENIKKLF